MDYLARVEPILLEMHSLILGPVFVLDSPRFFELAGHFNKEFNNLLKKYPELTEEKLPAKAALKFCQNIMEYVSFFARYQDTLANPVHDVTADFLKMIEEREELIATKYRFLAEQELNTFNNQDFRRRLSESLERMLRR